MPTPRAELTSHPDLMPVPQIVASAPAAMVRAPRISQARWMELPTGHNLHHSRCLPSFRCRRDLLPHVGGLGNSLVRCSSAQVPGAEKRISCFVTYHPQAQPAHTFFHRLPDTRANLQYVPVLNTHSVSLYIPRLSRAATSHGLEPRVTPGFFLSWFHRL
jgi:hypothetical protein